MMNVDIRKKHIQHSFFTLFPMVQSASGYDAQEQRYIGFFWCISEKTNCIKVANEFQMAYND